MTAEPSRKAILAFFLLLAGGTLVFVLGLVPLYAQGLPVSAGWIGVVAHVPLVAAMVGIAWAVLVRYLGRDPLDEGFALPDAGTIPRVAAGAVVGVALAMAAALVAAGPLPLAARPTSLGVLVPAFLAFVGSAAVPLVALNGLVSCVRPHWGSAAAIGLASLVFTSFRLDPNVSPQALSTTFAFGVLALLVVRGRGPSAYPAALGLHAGWNWTVAAILGSPLSGEPSVWGVFAWPNPGPGGAYGLEGSWVAVGVLTIAAVVAAVLRRS